MPVAIWAHEWYNKWSYEEYHECSNNDKANMFYTKSVQPKPPICHVVTLPQKIMVYPIGFKRHVWHKSHYNHLLKTKLGDYILKKIYIEVSVFSLLYQAGYVVFICASL